MPDGENHKFIANTLPLAQRQYDAESFDLDDETAGRINEARGGGKPMEDVLQEQMNASLGHDFSEVRIHTSAEADELNHRLSARAFTISSDIFFAQGAYNPYTWQGRELIAHELIHVVQQRPVRYSNTSSGITVSSACEALELEAASLAARATAQPWRDSNDGGVTINLRAKHPQIVLRALQDECTRAAPVQQYELSCHAATLWWIYRTSHSGTPCNRNGWDQFVAALDNRTSNELIADLIASYGRNRKMGLGLWFRVQVGAVVVFAQGTTAALVAQGHSCVCGGGNNLYGHSQGEWFKTCKHGNVGQHCHHWASCIDWMEGYKLYQVGSGEVSTWARGIW